MCAGGGLRIGLRIGPWLCPWLGRRVVALLLLMCLPGLAGMAMAQELEPQSPNRVKAAFLRNFAHYVTWPGSAFAGSASPWSIGVLGPDPFGDVLEATLRGRTEQGRSFEVFRADMLDELPPCQIVFVAYKDAAKRRAALGILRTRPVLTVGDGPGFLKEGGVIQFQVDDRVRMSVNLDQARSASLTIQTRMLEVASEVLENGTMRPMKER